MRNESTTIVVINDKQRKLVYFLEKIGLIKIEGYDGLRYHLSGNVVGSFVYISGVRVIRKFLQEKFNEGFLISKDGIDRKNFNHLADTIDRILEESEADENM